MLGQLLHRERGDIDNAEACYRAALENGSAVGNTGNYNTIHSIVVITDRECIPS